MHQSIPPAPSPPPPPPPPPPGQLRGICPPCQSRGWGICKCCTARGPSICQPPGQSRAFDTHAVSRREVLIRILALLQRKTLIKPKNRTSKCLKRHHLTVRSRKNVAVLTEDGAFALFFRPHPGGFDSSRAPTPRNLPSKEKKKC